MRALFRTDDSLPLMIVRLALGIVMLPHGAQKALGLFGGPGYSGTMANIDGYTTRAFRVSRLKAHSWDSLVPASISLRGKNRKSR